MMAGFWKNRSHNLVRMSLGDLVVEFFTYPAALSVGLLATCFYEFSHYVQHLNTPPKSAFMKRTKQLHLAHHFHNERGNYGITNFVWDRLFGTYYAKVKLVPKSATVFNIDYTEEMAAKCPWVNELSNFTRGGGNPRRFRGGDSSPDTAAANGW